jgi:hypothetical protein
MKTGRNDPCPCGSGKKYKHCCMRVSRVLSADQRRAVFTARELRSLSSTRFLEELDPLETLVWLSATAAYPCNGGFLTRISLAMGLLLAAKSKRDGREPQRTDIEHLFELVEAEFGQQLDVIEDFIPFDNLCDVRIGWNRRMYRFFFGVLERPLAYAEKFIVEYSLFDDLLFSHHGFAARDAFEFTLNYHDSLLSALIDREQASPTPQADLEHWYVRVPPAEFVAFWRSRLPIRERQFADFMPENRIGRCRRWIDRYTHELGDEFAIRKGVTNFLGDRAFIGIDDHLIAPLPALGISQLYDQLHNALEAVPSRVLVDARHVYRQYTIGRVWRLLKHLFARRHASLFPQAVFRNGEREANVPIAVLFDTDKLMLVDVVTSISGQRELQESFADSLERVKRVESILEQPATILAADASGTLIQEPVELTRDRELVTIIIVNALVLDQMALRLSYSPPGIFETIRLLDFEGVALNSKDGMAFFKFLRSWHCLQQQVEAVIGGTILDAYAWYEENNCRFLPGGTEYDGFLISPHSWSVREMEKLTEQAYVRAVCHEEGLSEFVQVRHVGDSGLQLFDPGTLKGMLIMPDAQLHRRLTLRIAEPGMSAERDVRVNQSLAEAIRFLLEGHLSDFWQFLDRVSGCPCKQCDVLFLSRRTAQQEYGWAVTGRAFDKQPDSVVVPLSSRREDDYLSGVVVYDTDSLLDLMAGPSTSAESQAIQALLASLVDGCDVDGSELIAKVITSPRKAISLHKLGFSQNLEGLRDPIEPPLHDISWVRRQISLRLRQQNISPGKYEGSEATRIINEVVYPHLKELLLQRVCEYRLNELLIRAYSELEHFESHRQKKAMQMSLDAESMHLDYDPTEKLAYLRRDTTLNLSALTTLIEVVVQTEPCGDQPLSVEAWDRMFALAKMLFRAGMTSEAIYFDVLPSVLIVDDDFSLEYDTPDIHPVDLKSFRMLEAQSDLHGLAERVTGAPRSRREHQPLTQRIPELRGVDEEFERQFGVDLEDYLVVLLGLASYGVPDVNDLAPLITASKSEIVAQLVEDVKDLAPETAEIALDHLSLNAAKLEQEKIEPWRLRSRKYRLVTHPVVSLEGGEQETLLFGTWFVARSAHIFLWYLENGLLPFPDDMLAASLNEELGRYRQVLNRAFENKVRIQLEKAGYHAERMTLDVVDSLCGGLGDENPGEIDVVFADEDAETVWVVEVKDVSRRITPRKMNSELRKFFDGEDSYSEKLRRKVEAVAASLPQFLSHLNASPKLSWQVKGAFVTSRLVASAFARQGDFPFYTLDDFLNYLIEKSQDTAN